MSEDTFVPGLPAGLDREAVEVDVILDNVLVFLHLQVIRLAAAVIDAVFGISCGVEGSELGSEHLDKCRPITNRPSILESQRSPEWKAQRTPELCLGDRIERK